MLLSTFTGAFKKNSSFEEVFSVLKEAGFAAYDFALQLMLQANDTGLIPAVLQFEQPSQGI